jgi:hypothetical protein
MPYALTALNSGKDNAKSIIEFKIFIACLRCGSKHLTTINSYGDVILILNDIAANN